MDSNSSDGCGVSETVPSAQPMEIHGDEDVAEIMGKIAKEAHQLYIQLLLLKKEIRLTACSLKKHSDSKKTQ